MGRGQSKKKGGRGRRRRRGRIVAGGVCGIAGIEEK